MKADVHPNYYVATVSCACGTTFKTRATKKEIKLDICSGCHPFYKIGRASCRERV